MKKGKIDGSVVKNTCCSVEVSGHLPAFKSGCPKISVTPALENSEMSSVLYKYLHSHA